MVTSDLIIIAKYIDCLILSSFILFFQVTVYSKYLLDYMHLIKYISLKQNTFSQTYTHIENILFA